MNTRPVLRRIARLVTLFILALLLVGPVVSAAPTTDQPAAAAPSDSLVAPGPAARPLLNHPAGLPGPLATAGPAAAAPTAPVLHDTHTVTSTADSGPGSLRQALFDAGPGDTIAFSLTYPVTITLTSGELAITKSLTILGPGAENLAVSGNLASRVLLITGTNTAVALSGLTVAAGYVWDADGGGIYNAGTLTVTNATFSGNRATLGGGIYNGGTLIASNTTFSGNCASPPPFVASYGGGIVNAGTLTVTNATFSGNEAYGGPTGGGGGGGGIENWGTLMVTHTTFSGNRATSGGGIDNWGTLMVTNAIFAGNEAYVYGYGGGIRNGGTAAVTNATFSGNTAFGPGGSGGGIDNAGPLTVTNATFSGNAATNGGRGGGIYNHPDATLHLRSTIIANSSEGVDCLNDGTIGQNVANLIEDGSCDPQYSGDPNLGPLGDYGGDTWTHPLISPSLAIDHGDPTTCPPTDQRGYPRYGPCDIGSFEYASPCTPVEGAGFSWLPITPTVGEAVTFTGTVAAGSAPITYTWKLGVGSWQEGPVVTHTYDLPGPYTVWLTATNCATATATAVHMVAVACPEVANAGFTWTPLAPTEGEPVTFTATASSQRPLSYTWDLGDSMVAGGVTVTHVYSPAGDYHVTLTATNDCGSWQAVTDTLTVTPTCHEVGIVSVTTDISGCAVTLGAELTGDPPFTYLWDFGAFGASTATNPLVDFGVSGTYTGTLNVWNCGNPEPATSAFTVEVTCPRWYVYLPIVGKEYP